MLEEPIFEKGVFLYKKKFFHKQSYMFFFPIPARVVIPTFGNSSFLGQENWMLRTFSNAYGLYSK